MNRKTLLSTIENLANLLDSLEASAYTSTNDYVRMRVAQAIARTLLDDTISAFDEECDLDYVSGHGAGFQEGYVRGRADAGEGDYARDATADLRRDWAATVRTFK